MTANENREVISAHVATAHNRRWRMRAGFVPPNPFGKIDQVSTNPPVASPDLIEPAGPVDPAVSILALREPGGRLISVYCAYSSPCFPPAAVSEDGVASRTGAGARKSRSSKK